MHNDLIIKAINERRKLSFTYEGNDRVFDPHVLGINKKNHEVVLGWQAAGSSSQSNLPNWRMFEINKILNLYLTDIKFVPQPQEYNPFKTNIAHAFASVK